MSPITIRVHENLLGWRARDAHRDCRFRTLLFTGLFALASLVGCDEFGAPIDATSDGSGSPNGGTSTQPNDGPALSVPSSVGGVWTDHEGPCPGSKTPALWFDSRQIGYAGCGESADGTGLYRTFDGGMTWSRDAREFREIRINDIRRGPDGVLYGAGTSTIDRFSVWAFDETESPSPVPLYERSTNAFASVAQGKNVSVTEDGQILVDSLTGATAVYRPAGSETFQELPGVNDVVLTNPDARTFSQVARVVAHDNKFYAVGSTISEPARVFLPSRHPDATYHMESLDLQPSGRAGELRDIHVFSSEEILVVGSNNSQRRPIVAICDGDVYDPACWEHVDIAHVVEGGHVNRMAVRGRTVVAVGERFPTSAGGFVIRSDDGGRTWTDVGPSSVSTLSNVWLFEDGRIVVAGGGRTLQIMEPRR